jgi:CRISPR-associated protein Csd1
MILRRLYELAAWANLLGDPSTDPIDIACVVKVGRRGNYTGLIDLREDREIPVRGKRGKPKLVKTGGVRLPVPTRPVVWETKANRWKVTDPASSGEEKPAVFLADTLARVLPIDKLIAAEAEKKKENPEQAVLKCRAQRNTFWRFLRHAAEKTNDPSLLAVSEFGQQLLEPDDTLRQSLEGRIQEAKLPISSICTLEWTGAEGTVLQQRKVMDWWREFHKNDQERQQSNQLRGICQVTQRDAALTSSIQTRVNGLTRIGCRADAYLVTGLESANSYGLEGAVAGGVSAEGMDGFTRALHALIEQRLPSRKDKTRTGGTRSCLTVGKTMFLFWTRDMESSSGLEILDAGPDQFAGLLDSLHKSASAGASIPEAEQDQFRVLTLSGNSARVVVRDYLETPLPRVQRHLLEWFSDVKIADTSKEFQGQPNHRFTLSNLAAATIPLDSERKPDWKKLNPGIPLQLIQAALTFMPLPDSLLVACLGRLRAEGSVGFRAARMGLIKLCLNRTHCQENPMTDSLDRNRVRDKAYVCGRLLCFLARCQSPKSLGTEAQIVERFFGSAMMSPRSVFPTLLKLNRHHISIIRGQKKGFAFNLDAELDGILDLLGPEGKDLPDFPATHSLAEQGRFALGFYQQRAEYRRTSAENKLKNQPPADDSESPTEDESDS